MKATKRALQYVFCASVLVLLAAPVPNRAAPAGVPAPAFRPVLHDIVGHTSIPILLPAWLPAGSSGRWASAQAEVDSYAVFLPDELEYRLNRPHDWHYIQAYRIVNGKRFYPGTPVRLSGGRIGCYESEEENAGARPGDAVVSWVQGGVEYAVLEYCGDRADVVRMANSVVLVRAGKQHMAAVPNIAFRGVLAKVIRDTEVPVLLPAYLPAWPGGYYIEVGDDERNAWPIYFASHLDVGPEDDPADIGFFDAEKITAYTERERKGYSPGVPVRLTEGRMGYYLLNTTPHHRHDKGAISWIQKGIRYTIEWQTRSRKVLVQIANSVVRARVGRGWPSAAAIDRYSASHVDPKSQYCYDARYSGKEKGGQ